MTIDSLLADAVACHRAGRAAAAAAGYAAVLARDPGHGDALHLSGVVLAQRGRFAEAVTAMAQAAALYPAADGYRGNLAAAARRLDGGALAVAVSAAADALFDRGHRPAAAALYRWAALLRPGDVAAWFNGALARGGGDGAVSGFRHALALDPGLTAAADELGGIAFAARDYHGAVGWFRRAVERGGNAAAWRRLADAVKGTGDYATACRIYERSLCLDPADAGVWFNRGVTLGDDGRREEAIAAYDRAVALDPARPGPRFNRAHRLLQAGRWPEGWRDWDARLAEAVAVPRRGRPLWRGEAMAGRTLLLYAEQGHGDGIQFSRYAPLAAARSGARVVMECPPALVRLFRRLPGVDAVYPLEQAPDFDAVAPLMSLPGLFGTTPDTVPPPVLPPVPRSAAIPPGRRRVGLVWRSGDDTGDPRRSLPPEALAPLLAVPGVDWVGLQMGPAAGTVPGLPDGTEGIADFADTAQRMAGLDLMVSVDTAAAHLAGSLGLPLWVLLRHDACWRWLEGRDDSPWYPTARLFRQTVPHAWGPVVESVAAALRAWAAS
ncbi:tetratricopeptide (TPR) repeat protein [Azospirillum fermentarium]|uniref:tetratricopeptide repeat-containing glycosyltransferase family protein n=1 Tax=Azospirillum fermentarium TaxID=1233114 RepID=UPI00222642C1|nr:tetratricopeptide repeat-containing glycosyltransferase family protein [Azospirillum fermentarium]MCW2247238.1 tetratricopeptide (TPR) repeat protein [Azospirillum fermentarium]